MPFDQKSAELAAPRAMHRQISKCDNHHASVIYSVYPLSMMDDSLFMKSPPTVSQAPLDRLRIARLPVIVVGLSSIAVLGVLLGMGRLTLIESLSAIGIVGAVTAAASMLGTLSGNTDTKNDPRVDFDPAVGRFADALTEPCILVNERSVLVYANPAAQMQFPRLREGDPLVFTLRNPELVEAIDLALTTGKNQNVELHLTVPNETWYRASISPYSPFGIEGTSMLVIALHDFTEQKRTDRMRGDFVANASHELRTPLTSLRGFIETLQGPAAGDTEAQARFLSIMQAQAERMSGMIEDLLSLSRIELRQHVRPTGTVDLGQLTREVAETIETRAAEAGVHIDLNLPPSGAKVIGDGQELFEVVENLIENAIKYGGSGGTIEIAVTPETGRTGDHFAFSVSDKGPGIAAEHVPRLTERFYRVDGDSGRKTKGTGLGLAIVKHIVARHHGQLAIKSKPGEGTRVEVLLPRAKPDAQPH